MSKRGRDEDVAVCSICMDRLHSSGKHRSSVLLNCGHVFGHSCIMGWIAEKKKKGADCPTCKSACKKKDVRDVFIPTGSVLDASESERLKAELQQTQRTLEETKLRLAAVEAKASLWDKHVLGQKQQQSQQKPGFSSAHDLAAARALDFHSHDESLLVTQSSHLSRLSLVSGLLSPLLVCGAAIRDVACSTRPGSNLFLTAAADKLVCLWNVASGNLVDATEQLSCHPLAVQWVGDDELCFAVAQKNAVQFFDGSFLFSFFDDSRVLNVVLQSAEDSRRSSERCRHAVGASCAQSVPIRRPTVFRFSRRSRAC